MNEQVEMIPIVRIRILNPRHRERKRFELIVESIRALGLKKPIQVSLRAQDEPEGPGYDLVCGQGRIEAFQALGFTEIPALVVAVTKEERLLRSLIENIARRHTSGTPASESLNSPMERFAFRCGLIASKRRRSGCWAAAGNTAKDKFVKNWLARYKDRKANALSLGPAVGVPSKEFSIEDLFPEEFYVSCVDAVYAKQLAAAGADLKTMPKAEQIAKRVEALFESASVKFNKGSVCKALCGKIRAMKSVSELPALTAKSAETLFASVRKEFEGFAAD